MLWDVSGWRCSLFAVAAGCWQTCKPVSRLPSLLTANESQRICSFLAWKLPRSTNAFCLSLVPLLALYRLFGCVLGGGDRRVGAWRSCKRYPAQDHTTDLCRGIMMFSAFSFFPPLLLIPNILLAFLTPAQP